jgi:glycosyltransferase involved in cell wall biosynthesis
MKKVLLCSNGANLKTGFGKAAKAILEFLHKKGYDVYELGSGAKDGSEQLKNRPWKGRGAIPVNEAELAPLLTQHPQMREAVFFGEYMLDKIIKEEKIEAVILMEDIWKIYALNKPWFNKIPSIIITPVDSLPLLNVFQEQKDKFKNLFVKAPFAVDALHKLGINAQFFPAPFNHSAFKPLPKEQKLALRKLYGLEDTFIVGMVSRNQLRKLFVTLMREFKVFKDKNPGVKAKLLFHTHFNDSEMSWPIEKKRDELGLDKEDLLCTYVCKNCKGVQIQPFFGQNIGCGRCGVQDGLVNPGIEFGVTDEELNGIYNLMDFYCLAATSGGYELTMTEAMLAGLPTATCNYSFGEMYCKSGLTLPIEHVFYEEINSGGFLKSQPVPGSIVKVIEEVYYNLAKYQEIGLKSREWALREFDPKVHMQKIVDVIESTPNTFDYELDDVKNIDYPPDYEIVSDTDFILDLYTGIFKQHVLPNNPDVIKYCEKLKYSPREEIVRDIKAAAQQYNNSKNQVKVEDFIVQNDNKRLIYVINGGPQECFWSRNVLRGLKEKYHDFDIYLACPPNLMEVFDDLDFVKNMMPYHPNMDNSLVMEGHGEWKGLFDLCFSPKLATQNFAHANK